MEIKFKFKIEGKLHDIAWKDMCDAISMEGEGSVLCTTSKFLFTGIIDNKGQEVCEGHILENPNYDKDNWERCLVEYEPNEGCFGLKFYSPYGGEGMTDRTFQTIKTCIKNWGCYVIGHIETDPELLTAQSGPVRDK